MCRGDMRVVDESYAVSSCVKRAVSMPLLVIYLPSVV